MSRGGRGGYGRGGGYNSSRLNHGQMPFDVDEALELHAQNMRRDYGLFPPLVVPKPIHQDRRIRQQIEDYRDMQLKRRNGPFFRAGVDIASRGGILKERKNKSVFNAFEDNSTYLKERAAKAREFMEAEFNKLPFSKEMFPKELWETIGCGSGARYRPRIGRVSSKGTMKSRLDKFSDEEQEQPEQTEPKERSVGNDYKGEFDVRDDGYDDGDRDKEEKDVDEDDTDNDFEDGDDDMAGDYNAEQYFENGDDDQEENDGEGRDNDE